MGVTVATECLSGSTTTLKASSSQLVTIRWRLLAAVLGLGLLQVPIGRGHEGLTPPPRAWPVSSPAVNARVRVTVRLPPFKAPSTHGTRCHRVHCCQVRRSGSPYIV